MKQLILIRHAESEHHVKGLIGGWCDFVSHWIPVHLSICWWLGLDLEHRPSVTFESAPASLSILHDEPWGGHTVTCANDTAHLYAAGLQSDL